jgi:thiaminase/transcriptional activator TenA
VTTVRDLAGRDPARWAAATSHPFLDGARTGALPSAAFDRWLEQDRGFVATLAVAWRAVRDGAPAVDLALLDDGIAAFDDEVMWFDGIATERGLAVPAPALVEAAAYRAELLAVAEQPHAVALAAMWAVEATYLEAWRTALPGADAYRPFVAHWTGDGFVAFVARLEEAADVALHGAPDELVAEAAGAVARIAEHEAAFWAMTWSG